MTVASDNDLTEAAPLPELIQGGMGVGVSLWQLARAVAISGENLGVPVLGVVSGTGLTDILVHRLQHGDADTLRVLADYDPALATELQRIYAGNNHHRRLAPKPEVLVNGSEATQAHMLRLAVAAAYVEVTLARGGHHGPIGINILEKLQLMHLPIVLGAMLAGVDYVLSGAGIPYQVPKILRDFMTLQPGSYKLDVAGTAEKHVMRLDPRAVTPRRGTLKKPRFLAIVAHHALAMRLASTVDVDGFILEGPTAGGHNAPPRGKDVDAAGEPIYGQRDQPDLARMQALGKPFWLAGSFSGRLREARDLGAAGVQVGSPFALCNESGLEAGLKRELRCQITNSTLQVRTSVTASPTGFPFQVVQLGGTLSEAAVYQARRRVCNFGQLVQAYSKTGEPGSAIGFRCPAEPMNEYIRKGGALETAGDAVCLCNGLASAAGYGRALRDGLEPIILTLGKNVDFLSQIETEADGSYGAEAVVRSVFRSAAS